MKKKTILLIALVIMVTGAVVWGVSALAGQKVSLNSADFYADCAKRANEAQRGQLVIVNGQGFVEHKNAQGEYVTLQPDGTVTAGPTLSAD